MGDRHSSSFQNNEITIEPVTPSSRHSTNKNKKVLRRLNGFLIELGENDAKVCLQEADEIYEYYLPSTLLIEAKITAENQPFEMDEITMKTDSGFLTGYELRPLAKPFDAFVDTFQLDAERTQKRNLIFEKLKNAKG